MTKVPDEIRCLSWNTKVGRDAGKVARDLAGILDAQGHPHVVTLQEASGYIKALRKTIGGYRVIAAAGWKEAGQNVVLVRKDVPVTPLTTLRMKLRWVGPKHGLRHPGRTWPIVDIGGSKDWRIVGIHRVPIRGKNPKAWSEEHAALVRLAKRPASRSRALVLIGDQNAPAGDRDRLSPAALADDIGARVITTGAKVDYALVRGATGTGNRHGDHGSDHPLVSVKLTRNR